MLEQAMMTASDIMTRDVVVVHPDDSLLHAVRVMAKRRVSGLPVVEPDGRIVGMLSEGDIVRWHEGFDEKQSHWLEMLAEGGELSVAFLEGVRANHYKVRSAMSPGAVTIAEDTPGREIAHLMHQKGIKRVPVVRDGRMVGIVARSDLVRAFAERATTVAPADAGESPHLNVNEVLRRAREGKTVP